MKKILIEISYWIGCFLIGLARLWLGLRTTLLMMLTISIVMGVLGITMFGVVDLITPDINALGNIYWDIVAIVIGGLTMWFGFTQMINLDDKKVK